MTLTTRNWDPADYLTSQEAIREYLAAAFEDGDPQVIAAAFGDVARAKGMTETATETGLSRESLYRSLSEKGNPTLATVLAVAKSMGVCLTVK